MKPDGADCDHCYLRKYWQDKGQWKPCLGTEARDTVIVGTAPDKTSFEASEPFTGRLGVAVTGALHKNKWSRKQVQFEHTIACRLIDDDLKLTNAIVRRAGKDWLPPLDACAGRFYKAIRGAKNFLALGEAPFVALGLPKEFEGVKPTLENFGGFPMESRRGDKLLVTYDNAHYVGKWAKVFELDFNKALRYFAGKTSYTPPRIVMRPTPATLREFVRRAREQSLPVVVDVETRTEFKDLDGEPVFDAQFDILRIVSIGTGNVVLILPYEAVDGTDTLKRENGSTLCRVYAGAAAEEIAVIMRDFLSNAKPASLVGHNSWYYDKQVLDRVYECDTVFHEDTMAYAKLADSDLPKGLGYRTRMFTDCPAWKAEHTATTARDDASLCRYGGLDIANTARIRAPLIAAALAKSQLSLVDKFERLSDMAVKTHQIGLRVDERKRQEHDATLRERIDRGMRVITEVAGQDFNPKSPVQLATLMYDQWHFPIKKFTATGAPSTDGEAVLLAMGDDACTSEQYEFFRSLRDVVNARTEKANFIDKYAPGAGYVRDNGIIYPDYSAMGTVGWRWSSSNPNFQNIPGWMRDIFIADDGYVFVTADADQLELRGVVAEAGSSRYKDVILGGQIDTHNFTATIVWQDEYWKLPGAPTDRREKGDGTVFGDRRDLIKRFTYAFFYKAEVPTITKVLREAENQKPIIVNGAPLLGPNGKPVMQTVYPYVKLKEKAVEAIRTKLLAEMPEFRMWWNDCLQFAERHGYIEDPIWGLRRYFARGASPSEIINFGIQAAGAAVVHTAAFRMMYGLDGFKPLPYDRAKRIGPCIQIHDALGYHVPESMGDEVKKQLNEAFAQTHKGMPYGGKAKISRSLGK